MIFNAIITSEISIKKGQDVSIVLKFKKKSIELLNFRRYIAFVGACEFNQQNPLLHTCLLPMMHMYVMAACNTSVEY